MSAGFEVRAGFEDMLCLPSGEPAPDNATIIAVVAELKMSSGH
jgi:uncharacterized protein (DUF849 family)